MALVGENCKANFANSFPELFLSVLDTSERQVVPILSNRVPGGIDFFKEIGPKQGVTAISGLDSH